MAKEIDDFLPLVSVVIPAYNCEGYVKKAIDSILNQTYQNFEIIVGDDGSTDGTKAIIDSYTSCRIRKYHNAENLGNIKTRNKLFALAKGLYITIQDADDWSHPTRLEKQVNAFYNAPELGACGTNFFYVYMDGSLKEGIYMEEEFVNQPWPDLRFWPPSSIMIKNDVYKSIGGLNLYFDRLFAEDKYWIALISEKYKVVCVKEPLYFYRFNPLSLTKKLDNPRKLVVTTVVNELLRQRKETGTDWLEENKVEELQMFEAKLFRDKKWLSEQYRAFAAISIDSFSFLEASHLLFKSFSLHFVSGLQLKSLFYLLRMWIKAPFGKGPV